MRFHDFKEPTYTTLSKSSQLTLGAGDYRPDIISKDDLPDMDVVGINGVGDCIGIVAWSPNATLIYHMNEVDDYRLSFALLKFAQEARLVENDRLPSAISYLCSEEGFSDSSNNKSKFNAVVYPVLNELSTTHAFANTPFQLITSRPRSMMLLLAFLREAGINESQTCIDTEQSQIFIERKTGKISIECPSHTKEAERRFNEQPPRTLSDVEQLDRAVSEGNNQNVLTLIKTGCDIHYGDNPQGLSCSLGSREVIRSPLLSAAKLGHIDIVSSLLTAGIHYEEQISPFNKNTSLTTAIKYGHENIAHLFLDLVPRPSKEWLCKKNKDGLDALELAKTKGWSSVCDKINQIILGQTVSDSSPQRTQPVFFTPKRNEAADTQAAVGSNLGKIRK